MLYRYSKTLTLICRLGGPRIGPSCLSDDSLASLGSPSHSSSLQAKHYL
jgi:hypothetical protein